MGSLPLHYGSTISADHLMAAANSLGDLLVAWHENITPSCGSSATSQIVAVFLPTKMTNQGRLWQIPSSPELVGDPCEGDGNNRTRCEKPQVVAVGDNFILTYSRDLVTQTPTTSRLESVAVEVAVNPSGYNSAIFHYPPGTGGEGYELSGDVFPDGYEEGMSGGNVALCQFVAAGLPDENAALTAFLDQPGADGNLSWHHRRPVLAKTLLDSSDALGLSWSNYPDTGTTTTPDIDWRKIEVDETTSTFGEITQISDYGPSLTDVEHARAIFAYKGGTPSTLEAVLYRDRTTSSPTATAIWYTTSSSSDTRVDETTGTDDTNRPAYAVWNNGSEHYLVIVWDQENSSDQERPFIKILSID